MPLATLMSSYDHVLLDLDGCVRIGREPTPRAVEAIDALRAAGKGVAFVTNDSALAPEDVVRRLWAMGLRASVDEVVTVGAAIQHLVAVTPAWRTAFVIGQEPIWRHVQDAGAQIVNGTDLASRADVVVACGHPGFDYAELRTATRALLAGAALVAGGRDRTFPMPDGAWPGSGAVVAALEYAADVRAVSVGKPDPQMFLTALDRLGHGRALVVGDRLDSDLDGAHAAGLDGAIVLTGVTSLEEARAAPRAPVAISPTLGDLVLGADG